MQFIPAVIGCLGGGIGQLEEDLCQLIQDSNERRRIVSEMQKTVLNGRVRPWLEKCFPD